MFDTIRKTLTIITPSLRGQVVVLGLLFILSAFLEVLGIASILPFVHILSNPEVVETNTYLNWAYTYFEFQNKDDFLFASAFCVLAVLLITNLIIAGTQWFLFCFGGKCDHTIGMSLMNRYLSQSYRYFIDRNSSEMMKNIVQEVNVLIYQVLIPLLTIIAKTLTTIFIIALLVYSDPLLACLIGGFFTLLYGCVYLVYRKRISTIGEERLVSNNLRYKIADEIFSGIKDIKITGGEDQYSQEYATPSQTYTSASAINQMIRQIPRYFIEVIAFGSILLIILYMLQTKGDVNEALPIISLYAFAGYRLMPGLQQIFGNLTQLKFAKATLDKIHEEFITTDKIETNSSSRKLSFKKQISIENLSFAYGKKKILNDISTTIKKGKTIGIVGTTGAGKTTFVDLILGLLSTNDGSILIDNIKLTVNTMRGWQKNIGYVSQSVYLCDDTIAQNIAFGIPKNKISMKAVKAAAKIACIDEFIQSECADGYQTQAGERGVKLSGGQRQRIGIARALYRDPELLVLDEATSALDAETESKIMNDLYKYTKDKTVIIIAHRLSTLKKCNEILFFEKGKLEDKGSFSTLLKSNKKFAKLAKLSEI